MQECQHSTACVKQSHHMGYGQYLHNVHCTMYHAMWMGHPLHSNLLLPWQSASHADPCINCCIPGKAPAMQTHCPKDGAKQRRIIFLIQVTVTTANLRYTAACVPFQYRTLLENTHHHSAQTKICACCSSAADVHSLQAAQCRLLALLTTQVCPFTGFKQFPQTKLRTSAACAALTYGSIHTHSAVCKSKVNTYRTLSSITIPPCSSILSAVLGRHFHHALSLAVPLPPCQKDLPQGDIHSTRLPVGQALV